MKATDSQILFQIIFASGAASGNVTASIPDTSSDKGRASLTVGFPSENFTPIAAGGVPPFGSDWNGVLRMLFAAVQQLQARGIPIWDSNFATSVGGYPSEAVVSYGGNYYISGSDNNTTSPEAENTLWEIFGRSKFVKQGWGFSNFGSDQIYLGWREDGSGLGLGVDSTDEGTIALMADVIKQGLTDGTLEHVHVIPVHSLRR